MLDVIMNQAVRDNSVNAVCYVRMSISYLMSFIAPTYHSKLFLDCCGLVRKVLKDLQEDFGFTIGPGNQAYQVGVV